MRDDYNGDLPDIRATDEDRVGAQPAGQQRVAPEPPVVRALREPAPVRQRNGALWAVCVSLLIALIGLGYWSHQQQSRLQQQLVATQESFARISEDAAGQLQDISGKVIATESSLSEAEQARLRQITQLEEKVQQLLAALQTQENGLQAQQRELKSGQQQLQHLQQTSAAQAERLTEMAQLDELQQRSLTELQQQMAQAEEARVALRSELDRADEQLQQLEQLTALKQQLAAQDIELARQRGQLQALLEASSAPSVEQQRLDAVDEALRAIDSFRVQTNRTISTLQTQIGNLQQQMNQR